MPTISIIRETDLVTDAQVAAYVTAQNKQLTRDFAPDWGKTAKCVVGAKKGAWIVHIANKSDVAGALGYHTIDNGIPEAFVFADDDRKYGLNWTITTSHEVLEMVGDPTCNLTRPYPNGAQVSYEACDPIESDRFGYKIGNVWVSDFVRNAWFTGIINPKFAKTPYDFTGVLKAPLTLAKGGYMAIWENGQWTQKTMASEDGEVSRGVNSERTMHRMGLL